MDCAGHLDAPRHPHAGARSLGTDAGDVVGRGVESARIVIRNSRRTVRTVIAFGIAVGYLSPLWDSSRRDVSG